VDKSGYPIQSHQRKIHFSKTSFGLIPFTNQVLVSDCLASPEKKSADKFEVVLASFLEIFNIVPVNCNLASLDLIPQTLWLNWPQVPVQKSELYPTAEMVAVFQKYPTLFNASCKALE